MSQKEPDFELDLDFPDPPKPAGRGVALDLPAAALDLSDYTDHPAYKNMPRPAPQAAQVAAPQPAAPARPQTHRFEFTGSAGEFFRIWIVNIFLSVVTLGIYAAWAKVRARQYFYANTLLAGHNFEYLGNPVSILKGNLIVGALFAVFAFVQNVRPELALVALLGFFLVYPFLVYSSIRFLAANSSYRNVRFRFRGTLGESYAVYAGLPLLVPFTLGLILPYIVYRQRNYLFNNAAYGNRLNHFKGDSGAVYGIHFAALGIGILMSLGVGVLAYAVISALAGRVESLQELSFLFAGFVAVAAGYVAVILSSVLMQQYIQARLINYSFLNSFADGKVEFVSTVQPWSFVWLQVTNTLAIVFSVGLAIPWARVRYVKFILANLAVTTHGPLDDVIAAGAGKENALGDAATDFLNIDIGL